MFSGLCGEQSDIRPEYMNNPKELGKIRAMIDDLKNDANVNVKRLDIIGYASPEGTLEANRRLSEGRAMALRNYLATQYDFRRTSIISSLEVKTGKDW